MSSRGRRKAGTRGIDRRAPKKRGGARQDQGLRIDSHLASPADFTATVRPTTKLVSIPAVSTDPRTVRREERLNTALGQRPRAAESPGALDTIALPRPSISLPAASAPERATVAHQLRIPVSERRASPPASTNQVASSSFTIRRAARVTRIQVGLDFGTSSTKVMYQVLGAPERVIRPLDFAHGLSGYPSFAVPSVATFDRAGQLHLGASAHTLTQQADPESALSRFKMLLAGQHDARFLDRENYARFQEHVYRATGGEATCTPESLTATYLAFTIRLVRGCLARAVGSKDLDLAFNVSVPVDQRENNKVFSAFERTIGCAQVLEQEADESHSARDWLAKARELLPTITYDAAAAATRVFVLPEALAASSGYITSLGRRSGLHALIDIGAGTTDVSIFDLQLMKASGARSTWYAARSLPFGAWRSEQLVMQHLRTLGRSDLADRGAIHAVLQQRDDVGLQCRRIVRNELTALWERTRATWSEAFNHLKQESAWRGKNKVKVFLAGGGALLPSAEVVFAKAWMTRWEPYNCSVMPDPDAPTQPRSDAPFARQCVAFGLSTPVPEIGHYVLPADAPNNTPPPAPRRLIESDGDQLLPRWGWT
jgi:hypothetical protein